MQTTTTTTIQQEFDDGIWTLHIPNHTEDLEAALILVKEALIKSKAEARQTGTALHKESISNFISTTCSPSNINTIKSDELRNAYIRANDIDPKEMNPQKFGRLMTEYINDHELNVFGITRVAIRTGTGYKGIKFGRVQPPTIVEITEDSDDNEELVHNQQPTPIITTVSPPKILVMKPITTISPPKVLIEDPGCKPKTLVIIPPKITVPVPTVPPRMVASIDDPIAKVMAAPNNIIFSPSIKIAQPVRVPRWGGFN